MTNRPRLVLLAAALLLAPSLASAQWPSDLRRAFIDQCLAGCAANTKFTSLHRAECPPYCECMVKEAQSAIPAEEYTANPPAARLEALGGICGRRVFR